MAHVWHEKKYNLLDIMEQKETQLTEKELEKVTGGLSNSYGIVCPHCGSSNVTPCHSPSKGVTYLCCDCYHTIKLDEEK